MNEPYRQPVAWIARRRTRAVQRAAFITLCASGIVAYATSTFREELFWILLFAGPAAMGGSIGLHRMWRALAVSFDVTWRVAADGLHYTFGGASGAVSFTQIERVELRPDVVVIHMIPSGTNEIAAGSPGFDAFCATLRSEGERARVRISIGEATPLGAGAVLVHLGRSLLGLVFGPWVLGLVFRPRRLALAVALAVATVLFVYYLVVLAWPSIPLGIGLGIAGALLFGALARAKLRAVVANVSA